MALHCGHVNHRSHYQCLYLVYHAPPHTKLVRLSTVNVVWTFTCHISHSVPLSMSIIWPMPTAWYDLAEILESWHLNFPSTRCHLCIANLHCYLICLTVISQHCNSFSSLYHFIHHNLQIETLGHKMLCDTKQDDNTKISMLCFKKTYLWLQLSLVWKSFLLMYLVESDHWLLMLYVVLKKQQFFFYIYKW